mgnify:CR=1 FL=1
MKKVSVIKTGVGTVYLEEPQVSAFDSGGGYFTVSVKQKYWFATRPTSGAVDGGDASDLEALPTPEDDPAPEVYLIPPTTAHARRSTAPSRAKEF